MARKKVSSELSEYFRRIGKIGGAKGGKLGGKNRMESMTPKERTAMAKKAAAKSAEVRSKKAAAKKKPAATAE